MAKVFQKVLDDLKNAIDTFGHRYHACLSWYEDSDTKEKEFTKSFLDNARYWLDCRNECVRKFNKIKGKTVYDQWTFPY